MSNVDTETTATSGITFISAAVDYVGVVMIALFHRTSTRAAAAILEQGFRDGTGTYLTDVTFTGVWLSDRPLDCNEGAWGDALLSVSLDVTADQLADFECVEEGKTYREWLVPAVLLNAKGKVRLVDDCDQ